jgi:predicted nucleic acid-binding protein
MEIVTDASAIMAVVAMEPERENVIRVTRGAKIICPNMISYEIANGLTKMMKKKIIDEKNID